MTYRIVRFYRDRENEVLQTGVTLEAAKAHCNNTESSSKTAHDPDLSKGPWFDGFQNEATGEMG